MHTPELAVLYVQVAFDNQMHEVQLLKAADEKLWQLRGSVVSISGDGADPGAAADGPAALQEPDWTPCQVLPCVQLPALT